MNRANTRIARSALHFLLVSLACLFIFCGKASFAWGESQEHASYFSSGEKKAYIAQSSGKIGKRKRQAKKESSTFSTRKPDSCSDWAFGTGYSLELGKAGIDGKSLEEKISPKKKKKEEKELLSEKPKTARELRALRIAKARRLRQEQNKSGMELKLDSLEQNWTRRNDMEIDEEVPLDGHHRVRALAGVREDSVSFGVGPEVIVHEKNQIHSTLKSSSQPKVDTGIGLQLNVDF